MCNALPHSFAALLRLEEAAPSSVCVLVKASTRVHACG